MVSGPGPLSHGLDVPTSSKGLGDDIGTSTDTILHSCDYQIWSATTPVTTTRAEGQAVGLTFFGFNNLRNTTPGVRTIAVQVIRTNTSISRIMRGSQIMSHGGSHLFPAFVGPATVLGAWTMLEITIDDQVLGSLWFGPNFDLAESQPVVPS